MHELIKLYKPFKGLLQVDEWGERLGADMLTDILSLFEECAGALYSFRVFYNMDGVEVFEWLRKALLNFNARLWINVFKPACTKQKIKSR